MILNYKKINKNQINKKNYLFSLCNNFHKIFNTAYQSERNHGVSATLNASVQLAKFFVFIFQ